MDSEPNFVTHIVEAESRKALRIPSSFMVLGVPYQEEPVVTLDRNTVFLAHYPPNSEPITGRANTLTFLHVGSNDAVDVSRHVHSCKSIQFAGHVYSATSLFNIVKNLHRLENLKIMLGHSQGDFCLEDPMKSQWCPSVTTLKIIADVEYFEHLSKSESCIILMDSLLYLLQCLVYTAKGSFPNLEKLVLVLPRDQTLHNVAHHLIDSCPRLRRYVEAGFQQIPDSSDTEQVWNIQRPEVPGPISPILAEDEDNEDGENAENGYGEHEE